jgi:putative inorganic carbon (HCO3(-)) transporter
MSSQELVSTSSDGRDGQAATDEQIEHDELVVKPSDTPPVDHLQEIDKRSPFWRDRLVELGMVLSMACYYVVGNTNLGSARIFHINPLLTLPFLLIFAVLCWFRLSFAVALIPMAVPYYFLEKPVISHYEFELAEIALGVCLLVAFIQVMLQGPRWKYWLSWRELRDRAGPFAIPVLVFVLAAAVSVLVAFSHRFAFRAFHEEVIAPILYIVLALYCLRTRQDVMRLLLALFASAFLIALQGLAQYFLFRSTLVLESDGVRRVHAMFGSANNIGLFFDYTLPIGFALLVFGRKNAQNVQGFLQRWGVRIIMAALLLPMLLVLVLSQSLGAWIAISMACLGIVLLSIRSRRMLLFIVLGLLALAAVGVAVFFHPLLHFIKSWHDNSAGIGTVSKRLYLWLSALKIIKAHPLFGVGLDNWLCYYSPNTVCSIPTLHQHFWVIYVPGTTIPTGLKAEPFLSHPHNIFLHVWVSIGIFGLLAFIALIVLFFWQFARILRALRSATSKLLAGQHDLEWMLVGTGAAMLAGLIQGQGDSAFLAQDMAFCFWMLVTALLLLRVHAGTPWRGR